MAGLCHWFCYFVCYVVGSILLLGITTAAVSGWKSTPTQYHIQTDEGPERSFRYQTYNGQYRREKRLDDGTVLGSYGWVDPTGMLRMTDYIADRKGYRILKTHMEYVGLNTVEEATETRKVFVPVKHSSKVANFKLPAFYSATKRVTSTTTSTTQAPYLAEETKTTTLSSLLLPPTNEIDGSPSSLSSSSASAASTEGFLSSNSLEPLLVQDHPVPTASSRPSSVAINPNSLPFWARRANDNKFSLRAPVNGTYVATYVGPGRRGGKIPLRSVGGRDVFATYATPLKRPTGFIYKIPNMYHKEETETDGSRTGSFGYVDPFGIRRVIHYNAGHTGFGAARDFKFVGRQY